MSCSNMNGILLLKVMTPAPRIENLQFGLTIFHDSKNPTCQVIQAVPFSSPIVGGHQQPLERVTFSPSQKGHGLNHQVFNNFN